jgi:cyclohexyl-isocyanide hydratase
MTEIDRRKAILLALSAPFASYASRALAEEPQEAQHTMPPMSPEMAKVHWMGDEQIGMLMYPGMTVMDLIGPHCMFGSMMGAKIFLVAKTLEPVTSDAGVTITPTATFDTCPKDLTVLFTPGGTDGTGRCQRPGHPRVHG